MFQIFLEELKFVEEGVKLRGNLAFGMWRKGNILGMFR